MRAFTNEASGLKLRKSLRSSIVTGSRFTRHAMRPFRGISCVVAWVLMRASGLH